MRTIKLLLVLIASTAVLPGAASANNRRPPPMLPNAPKAGDAPAKTPAQAEPAAIKVPANFMKEVREQGAREAFWQLLQAVETNTLGPFLAIVGKDGFSYVDVGTKRQVSLAQAEAGAKAGVARFLDGPKEKVLQGVKAKKLEKAWTVLSNKPNQVEASINGSTGYGLVVSVTQQGGRWVLAEVSLEEQQGD